jgi:hypothetical protein
LSIIATDLAGNVSAQKDFSWAVDTTFPTIVSVTTSVTQTTATISWVTSEPTTTGLDWGQGAQTSNVIPEDTTFATSHSITLTGLTSFTAYSYIIVGHDQGGNALAVTKRAVRTSP